MNNQTIKHGLGIVSKPFGHWKKADLHVHTWHSEDVMPTHDVSPLALYEKALTRGMDFVTFTDHDTMDAYDEIGWSREHLITGVEVKLLDPVNIGHTLHINVYTLNRGQFEHIQTICTKAQNLEILIEYLRAENLPYSYNHPFWAESGETLNIQAVFDIASLFPVLEYNKGRVARLNQQAVKLAKRLGKGMVANTDTHSGHIGEAFTTAPGDNFPEYFASISRGQSELHHVDMTLHSFTWELRHRIHNLFDRRAWAFDKPDFNLDTGIDKVDQLIDKLISSPQNTRRPFTCSLGKILDMIAMSRIPALLFINGQEQLGKGIDQWLEGSSLYS